MNTRHQTNLLKLGLFLVSLIFCNSAFAALTIEIIGAGANQIPISVVPFASDTTAMSSVVAADLARSGMFKMIDPGAAAPHQPEEVRFADFKAKGAEALVIGSLNPLADGRTEIRFRLYDAVKQSQLAGLSYTVGRDQLRQVAHRIADVIYQTLTGDVGVFDTKIAYVLKQGKRYSLEVADSDGYGAQSLLSIGEPIISPAWSPDGKQIAYVSFEHGKAVVYAQDLASGRRHIVANYRGSNSAPAWSPDGRQLALALSRDGDTQIYLANSDGSGLTRIESSSGIDTEPRFSPDGTSLLFTSDRGGSPQVYRIARSGGRAERQTFDGNYNVSPRYSPDGKSFVFMHRTNGHFNIAVQDFASGQLQVLTDGDLDESPSFAPNGKLILYDSEYAGRGVLNIVSSDGRIKQRLTAQSGDIRDPAWGPLVK